VKVAFEASFARDLQRVKDKELLRRVRQIIAETKVAVWITELRDLKKLQGHDTFYRIRLGDYRIGVEVIAGEIIFVRFLHRREIYRYFP
jgi:mRNA interferase RelE/StbE